MTPPSRNSVDQALYGYRDGHRETVIAASSSFDEESSHRMLLMSDLLTSALRGDDDSYARAHGRWRWRSSRSGLLCGYPLRSTGRYALARTWLAQELPRPGCVWTHSLVVDDETIASSAMWEVMRLHRRPTGLDTSGYRDRAQISQNNESAATESGRSTPLYSIDRARRVVRALYGTAGRQVTPPCQQP